MADDLHLAAFMAAAQRNGLVVVAPVADPGVSIAGNYVSPPLAADTIKGVMEISAAIANAIEYYLQNTADPTLYRHYGSTDQTAMHWNGFVRMNKTIRNPDGSLAQLLYYSNNNNQNQYECGLVWLGSADAAHPTTKTPRLPSNTRMVNGTGAITAVAGAWTNGTLTFNSFNPVPGQKYACYGIGAQGATMYACRFVPASGMTPSNLYPGVPGSDTKLLMEMWYREDGKPWFVWDGINVPNISVLCSAADTAQVINMVVGEV